jgi:hypothetical protein
VKNKRKATHIIRIITSTRATRAAVITPNTSPASKVGAPHCNGYEILTL